MFTEHQNVKERSSRHGRAEMNPSRNHEVQSLASLNGLRIQDFHELWCRSQMWLGSGIVSVALVQAGGYSSDWTPSLETSTCHRCSPKTTKEKKKRISNRKLHEVQGKDQHTALLHSPCLVIFVNRLVSMLLRDLLQKHSHKCKER